MIVLLNTTANIIHSLIIHYQEVKVKSQQNFQTLSVKLLENKMVYRIPLGFHLQKAFLPIYSLTSPYGHLL